MASATALLMVITSLASWLGPAASGMLAPIPVIAWPLVVFAHVQGGRAGMAVIAFYLVVAGLLGRLGIAATFTLAVVLAVVLTLVVAAALRKR